MQQPTVSHPATGRRNGKQFDNIICAYMCQLVLNLAFHSNHRRKSPEDVGTSTQSLQWGTLMQIVPLLRFSKIYSAYSSLKHAISSEKFVFFWGGGAA